MYLRFKIGDQDFAIAKLGDPLDGEFIALHSAFLSDQPANWQSIDNAAKQFFDAHPTPEDHDSYFNNFTLIWQDLLKNRRLEAAEQLWQRTVEPALDWERANPDRRIHKGTPYYFWGMTALLRGDLDAGYLIMHQGVKEDQLTHHHNAPDTPGYALVSLHAEKRNQLFLKWVLDHAAFLESLITAYNGARGRGLTMREFKRRFLDVPPAIDTIFLLSYTIARLRNLSTIPEYAASSQFAGILELNLLFDLTLVIDVAIKAKRPNRNFIHHAETLLGIVGQPLTNQELGQINASFNHDFDATMLAILDRTYALRSGVSLSPIQSDVALSYGLRNHGAHDVSSPTAVWNRFHEIENAIFRVLFTTVEYLY